MVYTIFLVSAESCAGEDFWATLSNFLDFPRGEFDFMI